jgi:hypothetical protein
MIKTKKTIEMSAYYATKFTDPEFDYDTLVFDPVFVCLLCTRNMQGVPSKYLFGVRNVPEDRLMTMHGEDLNEVMSNAAAAQTLTGFDLTVERIQ